jgi:PAS domain-containing protein
MMHCTGYVKSGPPVGIQSTDNGNACLVAIARLQLTNLPSKIANNMLQFFMRTNKKGIITFVDRKAAELLNKPISEILGKHLWSLIHPADEQLVNESFNLIIHNNQHQIKVSY